jgi:hypothetical protein
MAVGDDAAGAGFALVPDTGTGGEVRLGATEINRTRDYVAQVKALVLAIWPITRGGTGASTASGARVNLGISSGTADPDDTVGGAVDGNLYFKIVGS